MSLSISLLAVESGHAIDASPESASQKTEFFVYENIYLSATPSEQEMAEFKKRKGAEVLDLRSFNELGNCSEPASAAKLGLQYNRVNFDPNTKIDSQVIKGITEVVEKSSGQPILIFCKSGVRAAAWLSIYLHQVKELSLDEALRAGKERGLSEKMEKSVREYLSAHSVAN